MKNYKKTVLFIFMTAILVSINSTYSFNVTKNPYSRNRWYENILDKDTRKEIIRMDDQLFGNRVRYYVRGLVKNNYTGVGINNALIVIYNSHYRILAKRYTNKNGFFNFSNLKFGKRTMIAKVSAKGYSTLIKTISKNDLVYGIDFSLISSYNFSINKNQTKQIFDPTNNAKLVVHGKILKRLDNQPVQYPVTINFSYIDPEKDLASMPGINMLGVSGRRKILTVLTSVGAVNIEARDSTGTRVYIDRAKERRFGLSTRLEINLTKFVKPGAGLTRILSWQFDENRGDLTWRKTKNKVKITTENRVRNEGNEDSQSYWKTKAVINSVEMAAFNLDKPWKGVPVVFYFKERYGDGRFQIIIESKTRTGGNFLVSRIFNSKNKIAVFKVLVPERNYIVVKVKTHFKQKIPKTIRKYRIPRARYFYKYAKNYTKIVDSRGRPPRWRNLGRILF